MKVVREIEARMGGRKQGTEDRKWVNQDRGNGMNKIKEEWMAGSNERINRMRE